MTNQKITELTANTTPTLTDVTVMVDDPAGTPATQKVTLQTLADLFVTNGIQFVATASASVANTAAETTVIGSGIGTLTLPANYFTVGKTLHIRAMGIISNTGTPTLTLKVKFGSTVLTATAAITTASGLSNNILIVDVYITCRTIGATGTVFAQGTAQIKDVLSGMPTTAAVTVDTTATHAVDITAQWGTASASNTLTVTNVVVERIN